MNGVLGRADTDAPTHRSLLSNACVLARFAAGGELPWPVYYEVVHELARVLGRDQGEADKIAADCRRYGEADPRSAPTDGTVPRDRTEVITRLLRWWDETSADSYLLGLRSGATTRRLLAALLLEAFAGVGAVQGNTAPSGAWDVSLSYRQFAELAGVSVDTVMRHQRHLARFVLIRKPAARRRVADTSTTWRIGLPDRPGVTFSTPQGGGTGPPTGCPQSGTGSASAAVLSAAGLASPAANAWYRNSNGWALFLELDLVEPRRAEDLAVAVGVSRRTAFRVLRRLAVDGLARATEDGWLRIDGPEPASFDWAEARRERHVAEREVYRRTIGRRSATS